MKMMVVTNIRHAKNKNSWTCDSKSLMPAMRKIMRPPPAIERYTIADTTDFMDFGASL